ncbi:MAG: ATP synthase F1 subunit delta [Deltaproteobacteria bacterium]|nr:ATP synthase F1 subunit delta [Deltaproteobacteria bacterium]
MSSSVAKRYGTALFKLARDENRLEDYGRELKFIADLVQNHGELKASLESPVLSTSSKKEILKALQAKLGLSAAVFNLLRVMVDHDRMPELALLVLNYTEMADQALGQARVKVQSVAPLGAQEAPLTQNLEKILGKKVILETVIDQDLLGGLRVQVGDQVFDASLKKELENLKANILENRF